MAVARTKVMRTLMRFRFIMRFIMWTFTPPTLVPSVRNKLADQMEAPGGGKIFEGTCKNLDRSIRPL